MRTWNDVTGANSIGPGQLGDVVVAFTAAGDTTEVRNAEMILANNTGQNLGSSYQWLDEGADFSRGDIYILETVNSEGLTERTILDVANFIDIFLPFLTK